MAKKNLKDYKMLKLKDLIGLSGITLGQFKIHCATGKYFPPLEAFLDGTFKEWQEYQNQRNFECDEIVSLIHLGGDKWLFAGIYAVEGVKARRKGDTHKLCQPEGAPRSWFEYTTREIDGLEHLTGHVIVIFKKNFRASYLKGKNYYDHLLVSEIREKRMSVGDFPGYNSVLISFRKLRIIVRENLPSWKSTLRNVSGVYIITDKATGKHYIGSASGGGGIWQRWTAYSKDGHGNNKELTQLIENSGKQYPNNFQFSILEVCDLNANDEQIMRREKYWKDVLLTREFGYNTN
jgi:hypothetical protein